LAAWDQVDRTFQKIIMRERKANKRVPTFSCTDNGFVQKLQNSLGLTFTYSAHLGFWQFLILKVQYFSKLMRCICWCGMVLMMHVRMTRLPICVNDCKGNQK
jgi:phage major head subunit gpT-like protein